MVRLRPNEEEPELLRRDHLDDLVRRRPSSFRSRHLLAADVDELIWHVERRLALEHLAGDGVAPVARPARGREVLAAWLDRHTEQRPLRGPFEVPRQLGPAAERAHAAGPAATRRPCDEVGSTADVDGLAVPVCREGRPDPAAVRADHGDREPCGRMLDVGNAAIDIADRCGLIEGRPDELVQLPGGIDVAHPVVAVRDDPELLEGLDEDSGEVAGVACMAVADRIRDVGERPAHLALDGIGCQEGLGVHRVEVVDSVEELGFDAGVAEGPRDDVEDHRAPEAPDVDRPGRRLAVVHDLRAADAGREVVGPVLGRMASRSSTSDLGGRLPTHRGGCQLPG